MHAPNKQVKVQHLGLLTYPAAWALQQTYFDQVVAAQRNNRAPALTAPVLTPNFLLFCEHPHVYTLGTSGTRDHLLAQEETLRAQGIAVYDTNRGGDITYHGPGQLVVYPILDLENFVKDVHRYLRLLEEAVIATLQEFGLAAGSIPGLTGVWLDAQNEQRASKVCAIGVRVSRWVTLHGLALNVNTDLSYFDHIVPCGLAGKAVTSMAAALGRPLALSAVASCLAQHMARLFAMQLIEDGVH